MPLPIGEAFARYRIVRLLGSGGMGEVYLVRNPRLCRHDAVKVLPADFPTRLGTALGNTLLQPKHQQRGTAAMVTTRVEAAQYLKDAGGLIAETPVDHLSDVDVINTPRVSAGRFACFRVISRTPSQDFRRSPPFP